MRLGIVPMTPAILRVHPRDEAISRPSENRQIPQETSYARQEAADGGDPPGSTPPVRLGCMYRLKPPSPLRLCRLICLSDTGVQLEPFGLRREESPTRPIELTVTTETGPTEELHLAGEIRHLTRAETGRVRIGVEFTRIESRVRHILAALVQPA